MKTTIELPDALLRDAKALAARNKTTLKAMLTHALEREIYSAERPTRRAYSVAEDGLPHLPARGARITADLVGRLLEDESA